MVAQRSTPGLLPLILLVLTPAVLAAPARINRRAIQPIYDGSQVSGKTYDYVIAGGGLTGSVLASRLSEDEGKSVLVVEAGYDEEQNDKVTGQFARPHKRSNQLTFRCQQVPVSLRHVPRLGVPDRPPDVRQRPTSDHALWARSRG